MIDYYEIHRHDEFSLFDGFGKAEDIAKRSSELEYKACGLTNHGNITGLVKHFKACSANNINPILGCEFYFQTKIDKEKRSYHLCLYAANMEGWKNLNRLTSLSNEEENYYYHGNIDFKMLEKYNEGLVCSSACIAGIISAAIEKGNYKAAIKLINKFKKIFGKRFFIEIQPIEIEEEGNEKGVKNRQIVVNKKLIEFAIETKTEVICTSDSHYIRKEDFPTYVKMHEIKGSKYGLGYSERYMPSKKEMHRRLMKYHGESYELIERGMKKFLSTVGDSREWFSFTPSIPKYTDDPEKTYKMMKSKCIKFLKENGKFDDKYKERLKTEFDVIKFHGFQDYFMVVQDYVNWAKNNGIAVGPGRGSAGNSLVNYSLGITLVDPIVFDNDFSRFLRKDKKKFPDIDCDFCKNRRNEVINYILQKHEGKGAQTLTYGCYNVKNLVNDLSKVCGVTEKEDQEEIKKYLSKYCNDSENLIDDGIYSDRRFAVYNAKFDNIITHFIKMYGKVRFFGTHASSVILSVDPINESLGLCRVQGKMRTSFDLHDAEFFGCFKFDILGLSSVSQAKELEDITGKPFSYKMLNDKKMIRMLNKDPTGVFQFETEGGISLIKAIGVDSFEDIVASVALNRPGPLTLEMDKKYAMNKVNIPDDTPWYKYTKKSFGTLIYQEQAMQIAKEIGGFSNSDADTIAKMDANHIPEEMAKKFYEIFMENAVKNGLKKEQAEEIFRSLIGYSFNRGHAVAYAMLSAELGYFKAHYPNEFWYITLKFEYDEKKRRRDEILYISDGGMILTPHVNGPAEFDLIEYEGEKVIIQGLSSIKGVGEKAAEAIVSERKKNGPYSDIDDMEDRIPKRILNSRVINSLKAANACCFNKKRYFDYVFKYNMGMSSKRSG